MRVYIYRMNGGAAPGMTPCYVATAGTVRAVGATGHDAFWALIARLSSRRNRSK